MERLRATPDWGERVIATNVCFEPLVGLLVRRELLMRSVRFNGDILTQAISHVAQSEWEWTREWTVELVVRAGRRGARAGERRPGWLEGPPAQEAALGIGAVFAELPAGISFDEARANVQIDIDELHAEAGL